MTGELCSISVIPGKLLTLFHHAPPFTLVEAVMDASAYTQFLGSHYAGSCPELDGDGKAQRRPRQFEPAGVNDCNVNHNSAYALFAAAIQNPPLIGGDSFAVYFAFRHRKLLSGRLPRNTDTPITLLPILPRGFQAGANNVAGLIPPIHGQERSPCLPLVRSRLVLDGGTI